ncbi:MAG: KEOPS complex N(6)-L-threonylcarbamoyladenine synthase Kae1 [Candidatus Odinarchaeota archaeon]
MKGQPPLILGIESTAHTLGIGIVRGRDIISDVRRTYVPIKGGIHPGESARFLSKNFSVVLEKALKNADIDKSEINGIAFSQGPGLGPCLRVGATGARAIALKLQKPLIGVNHCVAHVELGKVLTRVKDCVTLYVSGGNTQISVLNQGRYRLLGETQDIAVGNMIDTVAREIGLPHPGGPVVEKIAREGNELLDLPYTVKGMSLAFSGLLSAAVRLSTEGVRKEDLCYSLQEIAFSMLAEVTERALLATGKKAVMVTGGVAANAVLCEKLKMVAEENNIAFHAVPPSLAGDNGVMIAYNGLLHYQQQDFLKIRDSTVKPRWRIDEVDCPWL